MLSLALTKVKLKLPENFGEATKLLAMLCTTQLDSGLFSFVWLLMMVLFIVLLHLLFLEICHTCIQLLLGPGLRGRGQSLKMGSVCFYYFF